MKDDVYAITCTSLVMCFIIASYFYGRYVGIELVLDNIRKEMEKLDD